MSNYDLTTNIFSFCLTNLFFEHLSKSGWVTQGSSMNLWELPVHDFLRAGCPS